MDVRAARGQRRQAAKRAGVEAERAGLVGAERDLARQRTGRNGGLRVAVGDAVRKLVLIDAGS